MLFHQVTAFYGNQGGHQHEEFGLSHGKVIKTEASLNDKSEQVRVDQLLEGIFVYSGCLLGPHGGACSSAVFKEKIVLTRNSCLQMARKELDLVVMAQSNVTLCGPPIDYHYRVVCQPVSKRLLFYFLICQRSRFTQTIKPCVCSNNQAVLKEALS